MKNKFLAALLSMTMLISTMSMSVFATDVKSADSANQDTISQMTTEEVEEMEEAQAAADAGEVLADDPLNVEDEDPGNGRLEGNIPKEFYGDAGEDGDLAVRLQETAMYTHDARFKGYQVEKGVDVSYHNNNNCAGGVLDWKKVKADGVDFAIIRVCYRGTQTGTLAYDTKYKQNIEGAIAAGVKVGVYVFSQAITTKEAEQEADYILNGISGYKITLPVVFDYEYYPSGRFVSATKPNLGDRTRTDICLAFINRVKAAGYRPMVYANKSMLTNDLYASELSVKCPIWLARYNTVAEYAGDYEYWQYTSGGKVAGITGNVDMNFHYVSSIPVLEGSSSRVEKVSLKWNKIAGVTGYKIQRLNASTNKYETIKKITSNSTVAFTDTGLKAGTAYKYRMCTYKTTSSGTTNGSFSNVMTTTTQKSVFGRINVKSINVRKGAGATKPLLTKASRNTAVKVVGATGEWYKIHIKVKGVTKAGYVKAKYVAMLGTPTINTGKTSSSAVRIGWTKVSSANGYKVQRYSASKKKFVTIATITSGSTLTYKESGLNAGKVYMYRVIAYKNYSGAKVYGNYSVDMSFATK